MGRRRGARRGLGAVGLATTAVALLAAAAAGAQTDSGARAEWARAALALQYELSSDVGYRDAPWVGTHNSFNSTAEVGETLSASDSNQQLRIVDQLDLGIRSIELDLHWLPRPGSGARAVVVCHGLGASQGHGGCTTEPTLDQVLDPIVAWLRDPAHRDQVLNVHLQDELESAEGYDAAALILKARLGALLHAPSPPAAGRCEGLPLDLSRDDVRAAGAQVVLVSDCGPGGGWPTTVFDWGEAHEEGRPLGYRDYPDCDQEIPRSAYDAKMIRYFEDSTRLTEEASQTGAADKRDRITAETAAHMARCGVDLIDLDQLVPEDPRFEALVWSWAPDHPARGRCAVQRVSKAFGFGRWRSKRCRGKRAVACRRSSGRWIVDAHPTPARRGRAACKDRRAGYAVPRSGYEVQLLRKRMERKAVRSVWLGYRKKQGDWTALDRR
jgi:hypothetical protein